MKNGDRRQEVVRRRWRLLAQALCANSAGSRRRPYDSLENLANFFDLFEVSAQPQLAEPDASWYRYRAKLDEGRLSVRIRQPTAGFTIDQLVGFNNTGNVRVWPSEEVLAHLALKNRPFFAGKRVLEVGGGMSCLAGVFLALYAGCRSVQLTDGHPSAVQNVARIWQENAPNCADCAVGCEVLVWSEHRRQRRAYDVVLSADCLFFEECRADLLRLLEAALRPTGVVLMVAPRRGRSLREFVNCARGAGFRCSVRSRYDEAVWRRHTELRAHHWYDEDVHLPLLVVMTKRGAEGGSLWPADYWVSQARKYCEFCKCWIADNKPSVQFHENGKRHKAAVEAKIKEIGKKSVADKKAKDRMDDDIRKMEEAAMQAYMKDIQENPDFSSKATLEEAIKNNVSLPKVVAEQRRKPQWHEAKTESGEVYYWHSVSGDSRWDVPREGFISLKDQKIQSTATKKHIPKAPKRKHHHKGDKHKKKMRKDQAPMAANTEIPVPTFGPLPSGNPYGHWETVPESVPEEIDLQLPEKTNQPPKLAQPIVEDEPRIEFKEKSVASVEGFESGSASGGFQFKKRKINRTNARQSTSDY